MPFLGHNADLAADTYVKKPVALGDDAAWTLYPYFRSLMNKLYVAESQGLECSLLGSTQAPSRYPVVVRPVYNLYGMGLGTAFVHNEDQLEELMQPASFWCEFLTGPHLSIDLAIQNGKLLWHGAFQGFKDTSNQFTHWSVVTVPPARVQYTLTWLRVYAPTFIGMVNVEMIGKRIIEVHLRPGDCLLVDRKSFLSSLASLTDCGVWTHLSPLPGYHLVPIWKPPIPCANPPHVYVDTRSDGPRLALLHGPCLESILT